MRGTIPAKVVWLCLFFSLPAFAQKAPEGIWEGYDGEWLHVSQQLVALAEATPIWLCRTPPESHRDLLLLLDDEPPPQFASWFTQFERVIEVVSADPADRALARARFKAYRDAGFAPLAHEIGIS